jgi:hypothetical protein
VLGGLAGLGTDLLRDGGRGRQRSQRRQRLRRRARRRRRQPSRRRRRPKVCAQGPLQRHERYKVERKRAGSEEGPAGAGAEGPP